MLEVIKELKVRKDNLYVPITRYKLNNLRLDLHTSQITIKVEFWDRNNSKFVKHYDMGKINDTNVDELIKELHIRIQNEG